MAVTAARLNKGAVPGKAKLTVTKVTFDNSYQEGGEPLTATQLGLRRVVYSQCQIINGSEEATVRPTNCFYTPSTAKIHLIDSATGKEVASTKDMSKCVAEVFAWGY